MFRYIILPSFHYAYKFRKILQLVLICFWEALYIRLRHNQCQFRIRLRKGYSLLQGKQIFFLNPIRFRENLSPPIFACRFLPPEQQDLWQEIQNYDNRNCLEIKNPDVSYLLSEPVLQIQDRSLRITLTNDVQEIFPLLDFLRFNTSLAILTNSSTDSNAF